jgi:hypothetical protein
MGIPRCSSGESIDHEGMRGVDVCSDQLDAMPGESFLAARMTPNDLGLDSSDNGNGVYDLCGTRFETSLTATSMTSPTRTIHPAAIGAVTSTWGVFRLLLGVTSAKSDTVRTVGARETQWKWSTASRLLFVPGREVRGCSWMGRASQCRRALVPDCRCRRHILSFVPRKH